MYNGVPVKDNLTDESGCKKGSVMNWKDGITTRAVLYDIAQLKGVDWVDPNVPITRADLGAWEKKSGVKAGPGDTTPWMHERLPAFIGHDFNIVECLDLEQAVAAARRLNRYEFIITFGPLPVEGGTGSPVNPLAIF
jgi:hypothetical protein